MDGSQGKLKPRSLKFQLYAWLSATLLTAAIVGGSFSFVSAQREANEFLDDQLRQVAALVDQYGVTVGKEASFIREDLLDPDARVLVQVLGAPHPPAERLHKDLPLLPDSLGEGIQTRFVGGEYWRVFVYKLDAQQRIAVAQRMAERDLIARNSAIQTITPLLTLIPVMGVLIAMIVYRLLKPVTTLSAEVDARQNHDLRRLNDKDIPAEIRPLTSSINSLLVRVAESMEMQRRFVADAAHELRTPLTALSLQADGVSNQDLPAATKERMAALREGLKRTRALLEQLLTLARAQAPATSPAVQVSMQAIVRRVMEDVEPLAEAHGIDVGVSGGLAEHDIQITAREIDMFSLVRNLVDNAIRYTPFGGKVDVTVSVKDADIVLEVTDTGPGIPSAEREKVLEPFYRMLGNDETGSGLGLSIVKNIVNRMDGRIFLQDANGPPHARGLNAIVIMQQHRQKMADHD